MKLNIVTFLFMVIFSVASAQKFHIEKISEKNPTFEQDVYVFPILKGSDSKITSKINNFLIEEQLNLKPDQPHQSIFQNVWKTKQNPTATINDLTYKVNLLNHHVYSILISGEFCSGYCDYYATSYNFNLANGAPILLKDLFSEDGKIELLKILNTHKKERVQFKIQEIESYLSSNTLDENEKDYYSEMYSLYETCITEYVNLDYFNFSIHKDVLKIVISPCSTYQNRAIDELGALEKVIPIDLMNEKLSELGKDILLLNKS